MKRAKTWLLALPLLPICFSSLSSRSLFGGYPVASQTAVFVYVVNGVSLERLVAIPEMRQLVSRGGIGLLTTHVSARDKTRARYYTVLNGRSSGAVQIGAPLLLYAVRDQPVPEDIPVCTTNQFSAGTQSACPNPPRNYPTYFALFDLRRGAGTNVSYRELGIPAERVPLRVVALDAERRLKSIRGRVLTLIVSPSPSTEMDRTGDEVTPLIAAWKSVTPAEAHALKSDTTRQVGLVANVDVAPTVLRFLRVPIPSEMEGRPVEVSDAELPFSLHRLHLEQRRIRLPIQLGEIAFVTFLAIMGVSLLVVLRVRGGLPPGLNKGAAFLTLCGLAFPVTVLAGGLLPRLTYGVVVPFVLITPILLAALSLTARSRGPMGPVRFLGAVSLGFVLLDGVLGGRAFRVPLMGGTMFDGVRFYGLPNAFIAVALAGALFLAAGLQAYRGFLLLIGVGLFAGFPSLGANLGAATTLFVAAGLWWAVSTREGFRLRELAFVAGVVALGIAAALLANRYLAEVPTHVGRFVEGAHGWRDVLPMVRRRLSVGFRQLNYVPAAYLPTLGLLLVAWLVRIRPRPLDRGLELAGERWTQAITVLSISSFAAFFVNDTGVAAAAPGFCYAAASLVYPALLATQPRTARAMA